jgi:hypothetical protein
LSAKRWDIRIGLRGYWLAACLFACSFLPAQVIPQDSVAAPKDSVRTGKAGLKGHPAAADSTQTLPNDIRIVKGEDSVARDTNKTGPFRRTEKTKITVSRLPNGLKTFYDPKVALRRSAILPGWGQLYNDRWWKVPFVYAGFATFTYLIIQNNKGYVEFNNAVMCKADTCSNDPYPLYSAQILISKREFYRKYRDMSVIFMGLWYTINLVDAYVDAHLRGFNVSPDLSMDIDPHFGINPRTNFNPYLGASVTLKLRR